MKYEKQVKAVVIFGDILGFSVWEQSITRPDIEFEPLMNHFDSLIEEFKESTGWFTKNLGDGYMQIIELPANGRTHKKAISVLEKAIHFSNIISAMIRKSDWPRPDGFRIRITSGYIWKKDGEKSDYVGRHVNLAHKLLRVYPRIETLAHQSFVEMISKREAKKMGVKFIKLDPERRTPEGVPVSDMSLLWEIRRVKGK